jgi:hypothetical protein
MMMIEQLVQRTVATFMNRPINLALKWKFQNHQGVTLSANYHVNLNYLAPLSKLPK